MDRREEVVLNAFLQHCQSTDTQTLSQADVHDVAMPALEAAFPDATAYGSRLKAAVESLIEQGDLNVTPDSEYRLSDDAIERANGQSEEDSTPATNQTEASANVTSEKTTVRQDEGTSVDEASSRTEATTTDVPSISSEASELETKTLYELLRSCQMGEAGAIVGGHVDKNELRKALYIETQEDDHLREFFVENYAKDGKHLVITGSAGDGKSALLSQAFKQAQTTGVDLEPEHIHMDATASRGKHQTYDDTLADFLDAVSKCLEQEAGPRTGLAINLGLAIDFFERQGYKSEYGQVWEAIDACRNEARYETEQVTVLNLGHRSTYSTAPAELGEGLLSEIVEKFAFDEPKSPFYYAYQQATDRCPAVDQCPLHYNARQFTDPDIRTEIVELIAATGLINNIYLNPRMILDLVSKIIVPEPMQSVPNTDNECPVGRSVNYGRQFDSGVVIWNALFERLGAHEDGNRGLLDPAAQAEKQTDQEILSWGAGPSALDQVLGDTPALEGKPIEDRARTALRKEYILDESTVRIARDWSWFQEFTGALSFFDPPEGLSGESYKRDAGSAVTTVTEALKGWTGRSDKSDDWIEFVDGIQGDYKFLSKWEKPTPSLTASKSKTQTETIPGQLWIVLQPGGEKLEIPVPITFGLYLLMKRISRGYRPNSRDLERSEGIRLIQSRLSEFTDKKDTVRIENKSDEAVLRLERDAFETIQVRSGEL